MTSLLRAIPAMVLSLCAGGARPREPGRDRQRRGRGSRRRHVRQRADHRPHPAERDRSGQAHAALSLDPHFQQRGGARRPSMRCGSAPRTGCRSRAFRCSASWRGPDYERADFAPEKQVGTYYYAGKSMLIDLRPAEARAVPPANVGHQLGRDRGKARRRGEAAGRRADPDRQQGARRHLRAVGQRLQRGLQLFDAGRRPGRARGTGTAS